MALKAKLATAAAILMLGACDGGGGDDFKGAPEAVRGLADYAEEAALERKAAPPEGGDAPAPEGGVMLAYTYAMGVSAPKGVVEPLMGAHQRHCLEAGPAVCQVLGSSVNRWGEDEVSAYLNLRAKPEWLEIFRGAIASDAQASGGKLISNTVSTEDLTRYIVDMDARLEAKVALRDRIKALLETSEGSLSDVLAAERALADVQGEIDSMTAQLAAARAKIAMSALSISYRSDPETSVGLFKPLREALGDFGRMSVQSIASAVRFVAHAWPYFIVLMIALAILRAWWRGRAKAGGRA